MVYPPCGTLNDTSPVVPFIRVIEPVEGTIVLLPQLWKFSVMAPTLATHPSRNNPTRRYCHFIKFSFCADNLHKIHPCVFSDRWIVLPVLKAGSLCTSSFHSYESID